MLDIQILEIKGDEPVTLAEAKAYCRVDADYTGEDALISDLISSSRSAIEMWANISLIEKRIQVFSDTDKTLCLPGSPVIVIESITDCEGNLIEYNEAIKNKVKIDHRGGYFVTYKAGFNPVPRDLKIAVLKQIATDFDNRENLVIGASTEKLSNATKNLVSPYNRNKIWL